MFCSCFSLLIRALFFSARCLSCGEASEATSSAEHRSRLLPTSTNTGWRCWRLAAAAAARSSAATHDVVVVGATEVFTRNPSRFPPVHELRTRFPTIVVTLKLLATWRWCGRCRPDGSSFFFADLPGIGWSCCHVTMTLCYVARIETLVSGETAGTLQEPKTATDSAKNFRVCD